MMDTIELDERALALSAHARHKAFQRMISGKAAALQPAKTPQQPVHRAPPLAPVAEPAKPKVHWFWFVNERPKSLTVLDIQKETCRHFGITMKDLLSHRRADKIAVAKMTAMYLSRELTPFSMPEIGRRFADKHHTTVLHAWQRISALILTNPKVAAEVRKLRAKLEAMQALL